jgi:Cytochrome c554 and c-prime
MRRNHKEHQGHEESASRKSVFALLLCALCVLCGYPNESAVAKPPAADLPAPARYFEFRGSASCASVACHNAAGPAGRRGSEYAAWISRDPHANAYSILYAKTSRQIVKRLYRLPYSVAPRPDTDALCLKCHGIDADAPQRNARFAPAEFGCESCHGPAEKWLSQHYLGGWRERSVRQKAEFGMRSTKDLLVRADLCVTCHVGGPDREVNHDLIAAGHPRLQFEMSSFLAILPKHWDEREEKRRFPDLEVRTWAIGQAASARAALELLAARADKSKVQSPKSKVQSPPHDFGLGTLDLGLPQPWPEFAEYDCFACHHDLQSPSWRQSRDLTRSAVRTSGRPGSLSWGGWYLSMLPEAVATIKPDGDSELTALLADLRTEMARTYPSPQVMASRARVAGKRLGSLSATLARSRYDNMVSLNQLLATVARDDRHVAKSSWDGAAQVFLALAAAYHSQGDLRRGRRIPRIREPLHDMARLLAFPWPIGYTYNSPKERTYAHRQEMFADALRSVKEQLGRLR